MSATTGKGQRLDPLQARSQPTGRLTNGDPWLEPPAKRSNTLPPIGAEEPSRRSRVTLQSYTSVAMGTLPLYEGAIEPDFNSDIQTGNDIIEYYARYGHSARIKVFYCNRASLRGHGSPYELIAVPRAYTDVEFYTVTAAGVVHHPADGSDPEYTPIGEWLREQSIYNLMRQMRFFKYYMQNRFFSRVTHMRRSTFPLCS